MVVLAYGDPAERSPPRRHSSIRSTAARVASGVIAGHAHAEITPGAGRGRQGGERRMSSCSEPTPGRGWLSGLDQLVTGAEHGEPSEGECSAAPRSRARRVRPPSAGPITVPRFDHDGAGGDVLARAPDVAAGFHLGEDRHLAAARMVSSTRTTASAPSGTIAPVEIAIACPGSSGASAG